MADVTKFGSSDGRLSGELAAALARRVTAQPHGPQQPGAKGAAFYHDSMSAFEATTEVLTKFGLLEPVPRADMPGETWYCLHALTIDANDMPKLLSSSVPQGDGRLFDLLVAFLQVFCHYDYLSDRHAPFSPPAYLLASMSVLARSGYAERIGNEFRWSELIGPAMRAAYVWDENFVSFAETEQAKLDAEATLAWQTIPESIQAAHFSERPLNKLVVAKLLHQCWNGEVWTPPSEKYEITNQFQLADRIIQIANGHRI
ncbi:hypothetical protein [Bradyrhizobium sp. AUGA SZCCT0182]|uniref:hypothetical protein n=1 Tax=Bradyrhizobium sp. AUGA SZCCT0182 TaxID=2807667 RepID=UPI001BABB013|nr:hypothetical protein [Bradyrhizobium sp. AUGA SZCCT0182]MBR1235816.1 hypothetical protein [Bradyrhizobium sp. AUGA SZCCT0182]